MNKEDKKLQKNLVDEMMKVSKTNPDVMIYMQTLMENYEKLEQKNIDLSQQLLSKKISDKDIEYKKRKEVEQELDKYKNIVDEAIKELETLLPLCIMPNNTLIHATEKSKTINKTLKILKGE